LVASAVEAFGSLDVLVNNAGVQPLATLAEVEDDAWRAMMAVNVDAVHRCTQAFARHRRAEGGGGAVVQIASIEGRTPAAAHGHYATSKAAVRMYARAAAQEYGPQGLRVNTVSPGLIVRAGLERDWPEGVAGYRAAAPLGRLGRAEEVGDACVFRASPRAAFITGAELVVDGGMQTVPGW
jgi:NAD(P)-dependent dehydrogenase (short-subunit alcohol dehydrogenase family)